MEVIVLIVFLVGILFGYAFRGLINREIKKVAESISAEIARVENSLKAEVAKVETSVKAKF